MAATTQYSALPYPTATDAPFVHLDLKSLAEKVDESLYVECTAAGRPPHKAGRRIFETDTKCTYVSDGTRWLGGPVRSVSGTANAGLSGTTETAVGATISGIPAGKFLVHVAGGVDYSAASPPTYEVKVYGGPSAATLLRTVTIAPGVNTATIPFATTIPVDTAATWQCRVAVRLTSAIGGTILVQTTTLDVEPTL